MWLVDFSNYILKYSHNLHYSLLSVQTVGLWWNICYGILWTVTNGYQSKEEKNAIWNAKKEIYVDFYVLQLKQLSTGHFNIYCKCAFAFRNEGRTWSWQPSHGDVGIGKKTF